MTFHTKRNDSGLLAVSVMSDDRLDSLATTEDLKRYVGQSALSAIDSIDIHFRSYREWQSIEFNIDALHVHIPGI